MTRRTSVIVALLLLAGSLAIGIPMHRWNDAHREKYDYASPDLQDARDVATAKKIITTWNWSRANDEVRRAMQLDLAFPLFYATLLALLAHRGSIGRPTRWVAQWGRSAALAAIVGGLADIGENVTMLGMLGNPAAPRFSLMLGFTFVKGAGILIAMLFLLFAHLDSVSAPDETASTAPDATASTAPDATASSAPDATASDVLPDT